MEIQMEWWFWYKGLNDRAHPVVEKNQSPNLIKIFQIVALAVAMGIVLIHYRVNPI
jgi:hypothetical protein